MAENVSSGAGLHTYRKELPERTQICLNISVFGFFVVFNSCPDNMVIYEYRSYLRASELSLFDVYYGNQVGLFLYIRDPFASLTFFLPNGGIVDITYGSLPNMCRNGVIISNKMGLLTIGSSTSKLQLLPSSDECVLISSSGLAQVSVDNSLKNGDQVLAYSNSLRPQAIPSIIDNPFLIRFITNSIIGSRSSKIDVSFPNNPQYPDEMFYEPYSKVNASCDPTPECNIWIFISPAQLILYIVFFILALALIGGILYATVKKYCPKDVSKPENEKEHDSVKFASVNTLMEARTEPAGYYAMDAIRNLES